MDHRSELMKAIEWFATYHGQNIGHEVFSALGENRVAGTAWCGASVRDIYLHAGIKTPESWDGVAAIHGWAYQAGLLGRGVTGAEPGDIVGHHDDHTAVVQSVHGDRVTTVAGNSLSGHHTVQVQTLPHDYWTWHAHMAPVISGHMVIPGAAAASVAQVAAVHGGGAAHVHLAAMLHGAAVLTAAHFGLALAVVAALFESEDDAAPVFEGQYPDVNLVSNVPDRMQYKPPGGWGNAW